MEEINFRLHILDRVQHCHIEFTDDMVPTQSYTPRGIRLINNSQEIEVINSELNKLLVKGVIMPSKHEKGEFISTIFVRPKKLG